MTDWERIVCEGAGIRMAPKPKDAIIADLVAELERAKKAIDRAKAELVKRQDRAA